jgi:hypothetical protein
MSDLKTNLVQSADAAARVGVLFVAVAMFAAMWESDSPPTSNSDEHWLARRAGVSKPVATLDDEQPEMVDRSQARIERGSVFEPTSLQTANVQPYPMPAGIAPGEYQVVDSFGMTDTLHITAEMVSHHDSHKASDQYIIENGDRQIFFIRIRKTTTIAGSRLESILR